MEERGLEEGVLGNRLHWKPETAKARKEDAKMKIKKKKVYDI
jgi:hypothetical protein